MRAPAALLTLCCLVDATVPAEAGKKRVRCQSGIKGDFGYKTCAAFCNEDKKTNHCQWCKCKECTFCGGSASPHSLSTKDGGNRSKLKVADGTGTEAVSLPKPKAGRKAKASAPSAATSALSAAPTEATPATPAAATPPISTPSAVSPASAGASANSSSQQSYIIGAGVVALIAAAALYAFSRPTPQHQRLATDPESSKPEDQANNELFSAAVRVRTLCVAFLCVQYAAYALLRRYSTGILKEPWSAASVLGAGEALKFSVSLAAIGAWQGTSEAPASSVRERLSFLVLHSAKMSVPAVIYLVMNFLGFVALRRVDAGTFAIVQQSKVFFTAALQRVMLGRALSVPKWCALTLLVLGVSLISLLSQPSRQCGGGAAAPTVATSTAASYLTGVAAVLADSALSGFATVYFEKMLKTTVLTVWDRNLQLAFWSMLIYVPWAIYEHPTQPFYGWSAVTVVLAALGAIGGILVALVIKHADGLAKNLATASSIVLTTGASYMLFAGPMSAEIMLGCLVVVTAGFTYQKVA